MNPAGVRGNPAWQKGKSGNPSGRPRRTDDDWNIINECRRLSPEALATIYQIMKTAVGDTTRLKAASIIIERAYGAPIVITASGTPEEIARAIREQQLACGVEPIGPVQETKNGME